MCENDISTRKITGYVRRLHTEKYILYLSKDYLFQVFQKFIYL